MRGSRCLESMEDEAVFMRQAIALAERGRHRVMPNPLVGCVLVRDGEVIAEGWHDHLGGLHAEQMAIADAEARAYQHRAQQLMSHSSPATISDELRHVLKLCSGQG